MPELTGTSHGKIVVLTFDDGYADVFENALPILAEFGFTALVISSAGVSGATILGHR